MRRTSVILVCVFVAAAHAQPSSNDPQVEGAFHEGPHGEAGPMTGTGQVRFAVTADDPAARTFFNQGIALIHGAWYYEAERSFRQVLLLDKESAMAYWGLALANTFNPSRRIWFAWEAYNRRAQASRRERMYIEAWARFLSAETQPETVLVDAEYGRRDAIPKPVTNAHRRRFMQDLSAIVTAFPRDVEAKALLLRARILSPSRRADEGPAHDRSLLEEIAEDAPMHPASRYGFACSSGDRTLAIASRATESAPGVARTWSDAGNAFATARRYSDAAMRFEAGARVDHAHMKRTGAVPYELPSYASNGAAWCRALTNAGRFGDAITLARSMIEMPRHPRRPRDTVAMGQRALLGALAAAGRWEELESLVATPYLSGNETAEAALALVAEGRKDDAAVLVGEAAASASADLAAKARESWTAGRQDDARRTLRQLYAAFPNLDPDAAPFQGLVPVAESMDLQTNGRSRLPAPGLDRHGPARWTPRPAPPFILPMGRGGERRLEDYAGRPVLVVFYLGAACLHCVEQIHEIKPKTRDFKRAGIDIVTIGTDDVSEVKAFIQQLDETGDSPMPFPLLADPKGGAFKQWSCWDAFEDEALHGTFLIDGAGLIRWRDISVEPFMATDFLLEECKRLLSFGR